MKLRVLNALAFSTLLLFACGEANNHSEEAVVEETTVESATYMADVEASKVNWRGEVAGVYGHEGFVNLNSGTITLNGENIEGGEFVVDMTGIYPTDSASYTEEEGHRASDLQGHLSTDDFFATETYPTAKFVITSAEGNTVKGNLTVRDKTNEETIEITSMEVTEDGLMATGNLVFNRQNYDVAWVHFMKDMILSDDIQLTLNLVAKKG